MTLHRHDFPRSGFLLNLCGMPHLLLHSSLTISSKGKTIQEVPLRDLEQVTIASRGDTVSTDALASCIEFGIPMNFLTPAGRPYALVTSPELNFNVQKDS